MKVKDHPNGKLIILSKALGSRTNYLHLFLAFAFFVAALFFIRKLLTEADNTGSIVVASIASVAFSMAAARFLNAAMKTEKLLVTPQYLDLIQEGFLKGRKRRFELSKISNFRHLAARRLTPHPINGTGYDVLGFQGHQHVINDMHGEDRLAFDYEGKTIKFGNKIYSWELSELEVLLYDITGNDLRYDDTTEEKMRADEN